MEDFLVQGLKENGLVDEEFDPKVKLHVTLLNTRFRKTLNGETIEDTTKERVTFDAKDILSMYGQVNFGNEVKLESLHLSERGKYDSDGYYHCVTKWNFP
eukprot:TRINITY_DN11210_c0_g1_i2.p1 TRINITY_DN11210_c0_g1~~TRINITY_DN11210_c0_g1_i2.p1  ORF type:complete len:100 (-),score=32.11 TRINITY_DN11210_c0_g1_i2:183-482(-)